MEDRDRRILEWEQANPNRATRDEDDYQRLWGWTLTRYTQHLHALLQRADVLAEYPQLVHRWERERDERAERRRRRNV